MKKDIIFSVTFLCFCFCINLSQAQTSQPDAEYQLIRRHYTVYSDSSSDFNFRKELKIIRNRAMTAYADKGETFILYNPSFETLTINESYTLRPDGTKVETPENAFVNQLPSNCTNCGRFSGIREMAIIHTGLEYGATIVLDYTIHRKSNILEEQLVLQQDCPVKEYEVIVDLPKNHQLNYELYQPNNQYSNYELNDGHTYHIDLHNLPQTYVDSYLPPSTQIYYTLSLSNQKTPALVYTPDNSAIKGADDLLASPNQDKPREYVQALHDYVVENVNHNNIAPALLNYNHATAAQVWQSNCGTTMEKAVLFSALLHQAGYSSTVIPGRLPVSESITLSDPDQTMVQVTIDGMNYLMSPIHKDSLNLQGEARDEVSEIRINKDLAYVPVSILDIPDTLHIARLSLPNDIILDPSLLTSTRTAPLQTELTNRSYHYTIALPKGVKMMGKKIKITREAEGLGLMKINIKQKGRKLIIERELEIEKSIITPECERALYEIFRQMMIDWQMYSFITCKYQKN